MTKKIDDLFPVTDSMEKALQDVLVHGTGIIKVNENGDLVHIAYKDILKLFQEIKLNKNWSIDDKED